MFFDLILLYNIVFCVAGLHVHVPNSDARGLGRGNGRDDDIYHEEDHPLDGATSGHVLHPLPSLCHSGGLTRS